MGFAEEVILNALQGCCEDNQGKKPFPETIIPVPRGERAVFMCLSDGMGSGLRRAGRVRILWTSGAVGRGRIFRETAAKMVNSVLNLKSRNGRFSVDISMVDLYSSVCHFSKGGQPHLLARTLGKSHFLYQSGSGAGAAGRL